MNWENIGSFKYRDDLDRTWDFGKKGRSFIIRHGEAAIRKGMEVMINGVISKGGGDVHLETCLGTGDAARLFLEHRPGLGIIVYPSKGEVERWCLTNEEFFSNVHVNPDPLVVILVSYGIHFHPTRTDNEIWYARDKLVLNRIDGGIFFKKNPFSNPDDYPGFQEFIDYSSR